ncbi:PIN domain-containing protein, partial [Streptomyces sp. NPDC090112]
MNIEKRRLSGRRTYVLDTSVLLADPNAISRFDEHEVVLPIV